MEHNIRFRRGITLFEDRLFDSLFFLYANSIAIMDQVFYNYVIKDKGLLTGSINNFDKLVKDKKNGVIERGLLRKLYLEDKGIDIFKYYNGTIIIGVLEMIVRGAKLPISKSLNAAKSYLELEDVQEAFKTTNLRGFTNKMKYPALMVKYGMMPLLVVLIHLASKMGISLSAD